MRTRRTKDQIRKDNYNKDVDAYNFYVVNLDTKRAETGFQFREDAVDLLNDYDDKKKYKVVSKRALKSMGIDNPNESFKYEGGGYFDGTIPEVSSYMTTYATGGGVKNNRVKVGVFSSEDLKSDVFLKAWEKKSKETGLTNIDLKTINKGGKTFIELYLIPNKSDSDVKIKDWYMKNYSTDDLGEELNDEVTFEDMWNEDYKKYNVYEVMGVGDSVIRERLFEHLAEIKGVTYDVVYKKLFLTGNYAKGGSLIGNQKSIDLNKNGKIDAEDFKLLRSTMNGAWRKEHKYVNSTSRKDGKVIDYEVIYARKYKPSRKGYKGKTNFADGGGIESAIKGYKEYTKKNWEGYDYFSEKYAVNELAELELDLRKLNDGKLAPSKVVGGGYKNAKKVAQEWLQSQIDKQKLAIKTNGLSNYINHRNFRNYLVEAKRENIISERKFNELLDESNEIIDSLPKTFANGGGVDSFSEYSNDALYDMIINLSRYQNTESDILRVKDILEKRKGKNKVVIEEMDLFDDKRLRLRNPVMPERKYSKREWAEKFNPRAYEFMGKDKMATGGSLPSGSINALGDLWFAVQQKDTDDYKMLSENLDNLNVPFAIQNEVSADAETQRGRKALNIPEVHDRIKKIVEKNNRKFASGGAVNVGYNVFNYTDDIYATDEVFKTKTLANKFIKEFRNRFTNQGYYRDNRMNKINIQDIDLLAIPSDFNPYRKYASGGGVSKFKMLSDKVSRNYEGKRVKPQYQKEYGKVYSKSEAKEVGDKVAGKVKANQKMASGGETKKGAKGGIMVLAKQIRKEGESWQDALKRAGQQLK